MLTPPMIIRPIPVGHTRREPQPNKLSDPDNPIYPAGIGAICSLVGIILCLVFMFLYPDSRLLITTIRIFRDWEALERVILDTTSYLPEANPPSLGHAVFARRLNTSEDFQDLIDRTIISSDALKNVTTREKDTWSNSPSLLQRMMGVSWCAYPNARAGVTPTTRNSGCRCLADVYLSFVRESANMSSNVTRELRERYVGRALSCVDQRHVSRTVTCGRSCSVHPLGMMLYCNSAVFLICVTYLMFTSESVHKLLEGWGPTTKMVTLKSLVLTAGLALIVPYMFDDWLGNLLNMGGIILVVLNLLFSLHEDLVPASHAPVSSDGSAPEGNPNPFVACMLVNFPIIIPAYTILLGLAGFGRDTWAVLVFGFVGGLIGLVIQRFAWTYWYASAKIQGETYRVLLCCFGCLMLQLAFMLFGYWDTNTKTTVGGVWCYIMFYILLFMLAALVNGDREDFLYHKSIKKSHNHYFSFQLACLLYIPLGLNLLFTSLSINDVLKG